MPPAPRSEVAALEFAVDAAPAGDEGQQPQGSLEHPVATGQAQLSQLEHECRVEGISGHPVLEHEAVGGEPVG